MACDVIKISMPLSMLLLSGGTSHGSACGGIPHIPGRVGQESEARTQGGWLLLTMTNRVAGALTMESAKLAALVDQGMGTQLSRLRDFASRGPVGP